MSRHKLFVAALILGLGLLLCAPATASVMVYGVFDEAPGGALWDDFPGVKMRDGYVESGGYWTNMMTIGYYPESNQEAKGAFGGGWPVATDIPFSFEWDRSSGLVSFQVTLAPDDQPHMSSQFEEYTNEDFRGIVVNLGGTASEGVTVKNLSVNGQLVGSGTFGSFTDVYYILANHDLAAFDDITVTGSVNFADLGADGSAEFARMAISLGAPVPLPPGVLLLGSGLLGLAALRYRRRR